MVFLIFLVVFSGNYKRCTKLSLLFTSGYKKHLHYLHDWIRNVDNVYTIWLNNSIWFHEQYFFLRNFFSCLITQFVYIFLPYKPEYHGFKFYHVFSTLDYPRYFNSMVLNSLFNKISGLGLGQVFSCEFCKNFKSTFHTRHLGETASGLAHLM